MLATIGISVIAMLAGLAVFALAMAARSKKRPSGCCGSHAAGAEPHVHGGQGCGCQTDAPTC